MCAASPLPVNIMAGPEAAGFGALAAAGVRGISYGPFPWRAAMALSDTDRVYDALLVTLVRAGDERAAERRAAAVPGIRRAGCGWG